MNNLKLSSPWTTFYHQVAELFKNDPDITIEMLEDEDDPTIKLFVNGEDKADALNKLLPGQKTFGNIVVDIRVIPCNKEDTKIDLFRRAFNGNSAISYIKSVSDPFENKVDYVVFENKVVQFFNDDISDINGNETTLYEDIAREVFNDAGVFFCTDTESKVIS